MNAPVPADHEDLSEHAMIIEQPDGSLTYINCTQADVIEDMFSRTGTWPSPGHAYLWGGSYEPPTTSPFDDFSQLFRNLGSR